MLKQATVMKAAIAIIVLIAAAAIGWYLLNDRKSAEPYRSTAGFFDATQVGTQDTVVKIKSTGFEPAILKIKKGTKVTFVDEAGDYAWPASDPHPTHTVLPGFDPLEPLTHGQAWSYTFVKAGDFKFHDHLHPGRRGTIVVEE